MVEERNTESAVEKNTTKTSDFLGAIGEAAKTAWASVREIERGLLNTGAEGDNLPKMRFSADDKGSNKYWDIFGNDNSFDSRFTTPQKNPEHLATSKAAQSDAKTTEGPMAWLEKSWSSLFGGGHKYEREKKDPEGNLTKTEWGPNGVDHTDKVSKTHVDRHGAFRMEVSDGQFTGAHVTMDRDNKTFSERGANGSLAVLDKDGKFHIADGFGNKVEWQDGKLIAISKDGTRSEVNDQNVVNRFRGWMVEQRRHANDAHGHDEHSGQHDGARRACVRTQHDDVNKGNQMVVVDDGKGTVVKIHQDGSKEVTVGEGADKTTFMTKPGSREILATRGDELYVLKPGTEKGAWEAFDIEGNKIGSVDNVLGGCARAGRHGDLSLSSSTVIGGDGALSTVNDEGSHVHVANDSCTAVLKNGAGEGHDVSITTKGATSTVTAEEASATNTTTVDTTSGAVKQDSIGVDGQSHTIFDLDKGRTDYLHIGTADGDIRAYLDRNGNELMEMWNKDILDAKQRQIRLHDGTIFDEKNGSVSFNDGTWIDSHGTLFDGSIRIGSVGEYWEDDEADYEQEMQETTARADAAASQAEALIAAVMSQPVPTVGEIGQLIAAYCAISGLKPALGQFAGFTRLDSVLAATDNAINSARAQVAQQEILKTLASVSPDLLAQANAQMHGSVLPEALKQFLVQKGVIEGQGQK